MVSNKIKAKNYLLVVPNSRAKGLDKTYPHKPPSSKAEICRLKCKFQFWRRVVYKQTIERHILLDTNATLFTRLDKTHIIIIF